MNFCFVALDEVEDLSEHTLFRFYGHVDQFLTPYVVRIRSDLLSSSSSPLRFYAAAFIVSTSTIPVTVNRRYYFFGCRTRITTGNGIDASVSGLIYFVASAGCVHVDEVKRMFLLNNSMTRHFQSNCLDNKSVLKNLNNEDLNLLECDDE
ncbi:hypothetical protein GEMRC1_012028 [Eukaryota sp. GEM-RC1]